MSKLRAGDWVEVRSKEEILRTLDKRAGWMACRSCRKCFNIADSGSKFSNARTRLATRLWNGTSPGRKLPEGIHLNLRCDGKAYGGCQAACLIFWKEAWLKPVDEDEQPETASDAATRRLFGRGRRTSDPRRRSKAGRRAKICLPGNRTAQFHDATSLVGRQTIRRGLHVRKRNAQPDAAWLFLCRLLLRKPRHSAETWGPGPLALRSLPSPVGRSSLSQASGNHPCR